MSKNTNLTMTSMEAEEESYFKSRTFPQILATLVVATTTFSLGAIIVWTSPSIPDIERKGVFPEFTVEHKSWIASLVTLGALACGPLSGYIIDKFGRRRSLMILSILMAIGWVLISTGLTVTVMCVGRFLTGFAAGGNMHVSVVYISEISEEHIRGILMTLTSVLCALGILYIYVLGTFVSWFTLSVSNILFPVILFIGTWFIPESPLHLMNLGKKQEAGKALMWLRGANHFHQIQSELNTISDSKKSVESKTDELNNNGYLTLNNFRAMGIVLVLMMCQQLSGVNAVLFYTLSIFEAAGSTLDPNICSIIIGIVILFPVIINLALIDRVGRRVLLIISQIGMTVSLVGLGSFFYLKKENEGITPNGLSLLPLASLMAFMVVYNIGAGPIPFLMMGELLPPKIKRFGCGFVTSFNWMLAFIVTKYFEVLVISIGIHNCFFLFSGICVLGLIFCVFCVPETQGKSLFDIQKENFTK